VFGSAADNVARLYSGLAADIRGGGHTVPRSDEALALHRLLDAVYTSARTGREVTARPAA